MHLRDVDVREVRQECRLGDVERGSKLDRAALSGGLPHDAEVLACKVELHALDKVLHIDLDVDKHVLHRNLRHVDRHYASAPLTTQTGVAIVDEEVSVQRCSCVVVHAARTVRHVAHHYHLCSCESILVTELLPRMSLITRE